MKKNIKLNDKNSIEPTQPNILTNVYSPFAKVGKCPSCSLLMFINDDKCPHCGHELTPEESKNLLKNFKSDRARSLRFAVISTPIFLVLLYFLAKGLA